MASTLLTKKAIQFNEVLHQLLPKIITNRFAFLVSNSFHQPPLQSASPLCLLHAWKDSREQLQVIILKVLLHTFGKIITAGRRCKEIS